jgi:hypothetical protein
MLSRLALMVQAAVLDGQFFDPVPPFDDGGVAGEVSNVSAYGTDWRYFVREDFRLIVVTEGSEDETEITDKTNGCCEGDQGHPPGNTQAVFGGRKDSYCTGWPAW